LGVSLALAAGCTVQTSTEPPTGSSIEPTGSSRESLSLLGVCAPLTCCFPNGGGWENNPFEKQLKSLGCSNPSAYTQSYGQSDWWLYSMCPGSIDLVELVLSYATVAPYYSQLVLNECLEAHALGDLDPGAVFVEWDPTCPNCYYSISR
jgi:hypothetical protein